MLSSRFIRAPGMGDNLVVKVVHYGLGSRNR